MGPNSLLFNFLQVDASPQLESNLKKELEKVAMAYGGAAGEDMTKFPDFKFVDPSVVDVDL